MANYHTYDTTGKIRVGTRRITVSSLKKDMEALRTAGTKMGIVDAGVTTIGTSLNKREILALKIGKKSDQKILLVGCHHAREWIAVEIPFLVGKYLIDNYKTAPVSDVEKRVKYMVDNSEIWIVPMVNPDGHEKTVADKLAGSDAWRANRKLTVLSSDLTIDRWVETTHYHTKPWKKYTLKYYKLDPTKTGKKVSEVVPAGSYEGVDLNRNYPVGSPPAGSAVPAWGTETHGETGSFRGGFIEICDKTGAVVDTLWSLTTSKSPDPPNTYCGPSAGSEPEGKAVTDLISKGNFKCCIDYHSYSQLILFPDDAVPKKDATVEFLGNGIDNLFKDRKAGYTYQSGAALYPTSGDSMSWAYRAHTIPYYIIELAPSENDGKDISEGGKGWAFNALPPSEIDTVFRHNLPAALSAINCSISGTTPSTKTTGTKAKKAVTTPNCWKNFIGWPSP